MVAALVVKAPEQAYKVENCGKTQYGKFARERGPIAEPILLSCAKAHVKPIKQRCDSRLCPTCIRRLAQLRKRTAFKYVQRAAELGYRVAHFILTVPNTRELGSLRELMAKVTKWKSRVRVSHNLAGISANLEVVWSSDRGWHPHIHCLIALRTSRERDRLNHGVFEYGELERQLVMEWHDLTGCSHACVVKRRSMNGAERGCRAGGSADLEDVVEPATRHGRKVAREVAKYVTKLSDHQDGDQLNPGLGDLAVAIHGMQLGRAYGVFHRKHFPKDATKSKAAQCEVCLELNEVYEWQVPPKQWSDPSLHYRGPPSQLWVAAIKGSEVARACLEDLAKRFPKLVTANGGLLD